MKCKDLEIKIDEKEPFKNDKLNRLPIANNLTTIVNLYADTGAVISLDGEWGAGKTTFIKMWKQFLVNNNYKCIYFNAWECDYKDDPFVALFSELNNIFNNSDSFKELVSRGSKILLKLGGGIIKGALAKTTGITVDALTATTEEIEEQCYNKIEEYQKSKESLANFKNKLSEFVAYEAKSNPLVFFIDELDRCNPHFAIKLLERIKHLFDVPNIIFVLAVNLNQLQYAVQGFYGSPNIDGCMYLKRFIDIEYHLPAPNMETYCDYLYEQYEIKSFFESDYRMYNSELKDASVLFLYLARDLLIASKMSLRAANRLFAYIRLALCGFDNNSNFSSSIFLLLTYFKEFQPDLYDAIKMGDYSIQELLYQIESHLPPSLFNYDEFSQHHIAWAVASLIIHYNRPSNRLEREQLHNNGTEENPSFPIKSNKINQSELNKGLNFYSKGRCLGYSMQSILERIDLVSSIRLNTI